MLLPGTFLGVWNLLSISQAHDVGMLSQAWLQAHGQAQLFGWIGSFILGIGFYSLTKMQSGCAFPARAGWTVWSLWILGVTLRWLAGVTAWNWTVELPLSAILQLAAFVLFYISVRRHRPQKAEEPEAWMRIVAASTLVFLVTLAANCGVLFWQASTGNTPALPHVLDQQFVVLAVWGILVPTIWGFNARWLPIFAGLKKTDDGRLRLLDEQFDVGGDDLLGSLGLGGRGKGGDVAGFVRSGIAVHCGFSVFEWLCCVFSQTRLGPGPRQQGRQVQEEGYLPPLQRSGSGTERAAAGRSAQAIGAPGGCSTPLGW